MKWYVIFELIDDYINYFWVTNMDILYHGMKPLCCEQVNYEDREYIKNEFLLPISEEEKDMFLGRNFNCEENLEWIRKNCPEAFL